MSVFTFLGPIETRARKTTKIKQQHDHEGNKPENKEQEQDNHNEDHSKKALISDKMI